MIGVEGRNATHNSDDNVATTTTKKSLFRRLIRDIFRNDSKDLKGVYQ